MVVRLCYADNRMASFEEGNPIIEDEAFYDEDVYREIREGFFNERFHVNLMNKARDLTSQLYIGFWDTSTNCTFQLHMVRWEGAFWIDGFPEILPIID